MDYDDYLPYIHKLEIVNAALLEALEQLFHTLEQTDFVPSPTESGDLDAIKEQWDHDCDKARAAIRQAKGKSDG